MVLDSRGIRTVCGQISGSHMIEVASTFPCASSYSAQASCKALRVAQLVVLRTLHVLQIPRSSEEEIAIWFFIEILYFQSFRTACFPHSNRQALPLPSKSLSLALVFSTTLKKITIPNSGKRNALMTSEKSNLILDSF